MINKAGIFSLSLFYFVTITNLMANLKPYVDLPSAKVLPQGVRNFRIKGLKSGGQNKYNNQGKLISVSEPLKKNVTFNDLLKGRKDPIERGKLKGYLKGKKYLASSGQEAIVGTTTGHIDLAVNSTIPIFAYGINPKWTMGIAIPIIHYDYRINTGFISKKPLKNFYSELVSEGRTEEAYDLEKKMANPIVTKLEDYNYINQGQYHEKGTRLGDITLVSKYLLLEKRNWQLALENTIILPTGKRQDLDKIVDIPSGDGQYKAGIGFSSDYLIPMPRLSMETMISARFHYLHPFANIARERIPEEEASKITPDIDQVVTRKLGDTYQFQIGPQFIFFNRGLILGTAYGLQMKDGDHYEGTAYERPRYDWMGKETTQRLQSIQLQATYSTVEQYKNKKFFMPGMFSIHYSHPFEGKNVYHTPLTTVELSVFF